MNITSDYQRFGIRQGHIQPLGARLRTKLDVIPLPDLAGKRVLDVGCHSGFWCYLAKERGARYVLGVDQNPLVSPIGSPSFHFKQMAIGKTWPNLGAFEVVLLLSVYHHLYKATGGDHESIWFWLWGCLYFEGELLAEIATSHKDHTILNLVPAELHANYAGWRTAAASYFDIEDIGPSEHEPLRRVYRMRPKLREAVTITGEVKKGYGMAAVLMKCEHGRRMTEIESLLGMRPYPGTLNLLACGFDWDSGYYRGEIMALNDRRKGPDGGWHPRWMRFYPLTVNNHPAYAARFENEYHRLDFVELIAETQLRKHPVSVGQFVELKRW